MRHRPLVIVFADAEPSAALIDVIGREFALRLHAAIVEDLVEAMAQAAPEVRLYLPSDENLLSRVSVPPAVETRTLRGTGAGTQAVNAFAESFAAGYEQVVLVAAAHPALPSEFITITIEALGDPCSVVLGPSADGSLYLLGLNELYPTLLTDADLAAPDAFGKVVERLAETDASLTVMPEWYGVRTKSDLHRLKNDLGSAAAVGARTRAVLEEHE